MSGVLGMLLGNGGGQPITVTIGGSDPYGFNSGSFGSISPTTFVDHSGSTRTPTILEYTSSGTQIIFRINQAVSDSDSVFVGLVVNGTYLSRASGTYSTDSSTYSQWNWNVGSNILGASGTATVVIV